MAGKRFTDEDMTNEVTENLQRFMNKANLDKKPKPTPKSKSFFDEELNPNQDLFGVNPDNEDDETDIHEDENDITEEIKLAYRKESVESEASPFQGSQSHFKNRKSKTKSNNPLSAYFREPGIYTKLPSKGYFNPEGTIDFTVNGEVAVYPMTAKDEVWFKNPDALLNGVAIEKVLESCCPEIHDIRNLPINDINVLLLGLRYSSYGKALHLKASCPKCKKENIFAVNIEDLLENISFLKEEYTAKVNSLEISFKPYTYDSMVKATIVTFEEAKVVQLVQNEEISDEERKELVRDSFQRIHNLSIDLMGDSIIHIVMPNGELVEDPNNIKEWLDQIDRKSYVVLKDKFEEINKIGVPSNYHVECEHCKHEFKIDLAYDPATFFE